MVSRFRAPLWRRFGGWFRGAGLVLLGIAAFAPIPASAVAVLGIPGLALLVTGALVWLTRDAEVWRR